LALKAAELGINVGYEKILAMTTDDLEEFQKALVKATDASKAIADLENEYSLINRKIARSEDLSLKRENASQKYNLANSGKLVSNENVQAYAKEYV